MAKRPVKPTSPVTPPALPPVVDDLPVVLSGDGAPLPEITEPPQEHTAPALPPGRCRCDGRSFVITRSRAKAGGGYERYCDGCGVVQG